ncbi:type II toxin-antitoxin system HipA family toxin [Comamonas endophytica]|uniref:Type II toxin-antitoxin system HipA family toxin n=1 Tax=Comamonas endophytica TaxID=2949090 RepID=A0ABY6GGI0_9BURK|nr:MULTISPECIES: type II toxin-antitoxin system HipA family toxin [unclassified Acidovorax]MCD2514369.1 type II toxin-antitoxin system HipA family toxin [Acidovorax sp. D4N7]UYG53612.1 type II toxin-antitoxin system HipA family toxin [Acidovorax sp. 5MLIR]UYG53659.1 type II toxin-antitoxin system HipA family toxin [Acidovorax sp. 5MLIR]
MPDSTPVWAWLPGATEPVRAAALSSDGRRYRFQYDPAYLAQAVGTPALDPVELRLKPAVLTTQELPGVLLDAKPAGYGQDRLNAQLHDRYQRDLTELELLEAGPADGVSAIEVCHDIDRKLRWSPPSIEGLQHELERLEEGAPGSRAMRRANGDAATSAGGERPKATFAHQGRLWLVKMQDRGDRQGMPAMEYAAMTLAAQADIDAAPVRLQTVGPHQALMVERFDRAGNPGTPQRSLFASAHTVLQLPPAAVRGHALRSYPILADRMRIWGRNADPSMLMRQLQQLWKRMAFNALVGNVDDHPRNHGLLFVDGAWQLAPAFDITPIWRPPQEHGASHMPVLAMATGADGSAGVEPQRLIAASGHFGMAAEEAAQYLLETSEMIVDRWEATLRQALAPLADRRPPAYADAVVNDTRAAFALSYSIVDSPALLAQAVQALHAPRQSGRRRLRR